MNPPPQKLVQRLKLSPFYKNYVDARGIAVLSSEIVEDAALKEAAYLIGRVLDGRDDLRTAIARSTVRFAVMAPTELTTNIPEHSDLTPKKYWDRRARGLGATPERPAVSCGAENLLSYPGDPYKGESILIHEFAHVIHEIALKVVEPSFAKRLKQTYDDALKAGLWRDTYAATNPSEYWAEGVQSWFDANQKRNASHNDIRTREQLEGYDPALAQLLQSVFRKNNWRYSPVTERLNQPHLRGFNSTKSPTFSWPSD